MKYITNIFQEVKEKINVYQFFDSIGYHLFVCGRCYRSNQCPACGISDNRYSNRLQITSNLEGWFCYSCGAKGDVITAAQYYKKLEFPKEAAEWLLHEWIGHKPLPKSAKPIHVTKEEIQKEKQKRLQIIKLLLQQVDNERLDCWRYLNKERGIPVNIIKMALNKKLICFMSPNFKIPLDLLKEARCEGPNGGFIFWNRPIMSPFLRKREVIGCEFRFAFTPQDKNIKKAKSLVAKTFWWWKGKQQNKTLIVEGIIDLLSALAMEWDGNIIGLPATGQTNLLIETCSDFLNKQEIFLSLDGDDAGKLASIKLQEAFKVPNSNILSIPQGKDLNDLWREGCKNWHELLNHAMIKKQIM